MDNNENIKNWMECCRPADEKSERLSELGSVELWNRRADGFAKKLKPANRRERMQIIFEMLDEVGFNADGAKVLDIGCGPGAISIPLAKAGADVTAVDISPKILGYIASNAKEEGVSMKTVECSWWTADIDELGFRNNFDLVINSMTPAVKDFETFDRMVACSRKYCFYGHFIRRGAGGIPDEIYRDILKTEPPKRSGEAMSPFINNFMYLYLKGIRPVVRISSRSRKKDFDKSGAAEMVINALEMKKSCSFVIKEQIRDYFKNTSEEKYSMSSGVSTGMMVWNINRL
ncbi:SAM-dependent methyltransferase [Methanomicrobium sp. W14]|uniref:class I SAM-dependent methyltransferase n=1 Tax=Methanomicrobium sp. W14 TaxID=2817839 RepID=UPI001AE27E41|nr:class I SAM-dependent methyltransferase [Methanomicrobium sp. W14]MBP2134029.1 SAM-dependent methyltransferase [Methanomicrobium sp. W14]